MNDFRKYSYIYIPGKEKNVVGGGVEVLFLLLLLVQPSPAPIKLGDK